MFIFLFCVIAIDQLFKIIVKANDLNISIIDNIFGITYVENTGIAFGMFQDSNLVMIGLTTLICIAIFIYMVQHIKLNVFKRNALSMILAGGIGNLIDRVARGFVIDYIQIPYIPVFNLADVCVVLGVVCLIIAMFKGEKKNVF